MSAGFETETLRLSLAYGSEPTAKLDTSFTTNLRIDRNFFFQRHFMWKRPLYISM
jgi:hypothetical protein